MSRLGLLQGKVAVITGSSRGLGFGIAEAYAREGAAVVLSSRSAAAVEQAVARLKATGARATGCVCDVSDAQQVDGLAAHALATFGALDIWVNNAGVSSPYGPTMSVTAASFLSTVQTNIIGTYNGTTTAMRHFLPRRSGKLINVMGRGDKGGPVPFQNAYTATKSWVRSFTLTLAKEYASSGVAIIAFNPGMVLTEMLTRVEAVEGWESGLKAFPTILRMWANPVEVPVRKALWLASPATDGKAGLEVHVMTPAGMLAGAIREGVRRLTGRPAPELDVQVRTVPAAGSED